MVFVSSRFEGYYLTIEYPMQTISSIKKDKAPRPAFIIATMTKRTLDTALFP
jgi:hypothetical protein